MSNGPGFIHAYTDALAQHATPPTVPFGYKRTTGQLQKGDAIWNGEKFVRVKRVPTEVIVRKTKMLYPCAPDGAVAIRRCEVVQAEIPGTEQGANLDE